MPASARHSVWRMLTDREPLFRVTHESASGEGAALDCVDCGSQRRRGQTPSVTLHTGWYKPVSQ